MPTNLPPILETAVERLNYVADVIEHDSDRWNQNYFHDETLGWKSPIGIAKERSCGSYGCAAGHALTVTPVGLLSDADDFEGAGAVAFGIDLDTAELLFHEGFGMDGDMQVSLPKEVRGERMVACLRWLASLSDEERANVTRYEILDYSNGRYA